MAAKAFVLITTAVGQTKSVLNGLKKIDGIKSVDAVMGPYDIIAVVEGDSVDSVGKLITEQFHKIAGIERTTTCQTIRIA
ncbi:MAG: Lrp/AsnC ligand binding domain-containing protein [Dehalococcoidia bacterium]|nr:Lrp/AsnC ligand binding domain-containing protein [Dehalococcoidia bacterium]MDD5495200.1 Lrp/AsnC ligand binding domain-containing protein [Dehalococcoidia bacterium]